MKAIKQVVRSSAEVKYCASANEDQALVPTVINTPSNLHPVLPKNGVGTGPQQRLGDQIRGAHGRVDLTFSFQENDRAARSYVIRVYQLHSKSISDGQYIPSLSAGTLLDIGNGTTTDWTPASTNVVQLTQMPISSSNWTVMKTLTFSLAKDVGGMNGDTSGSDAPNGAHFPTQHTCSLYWKHDAPLKYETQTGAPNTVYPTNYCPVYAYVAYSVDGQDLLEEPLAPIILTSRQHMWFTDA